MTPTTSLQPSVATILLVLGLLVTPAAHGAGLPAGLTPGTPGLDSVERHLLPPVDLGAVAAAEAARVGAGRPVPDRFATPVEAAFTPGDSGTWHDLADGRRVWRLRIGSTGAVNLNLALDPFQPPPGARLWLYSPDGATVHGPYTDRDRNADGALWTPVVPGDEVVVELDLPPGADPGPVRIARVHHGFRSLGGGDVKAGSCNVDVVCPDGDPWRDQIRSVARITILGVYLCSGQLLNNTAEDDTPYFLTAQHCVEDASQAPTVVAYWNYEAPSCGLQAGGSLAQNQSGATFLASSRWQSGTDFALLLLDDAPDPSFEVHFAGWDATGDTPPGAVAIHHPQGDEKSISFDDDPLVAVNYYGFGTHQWRVNAWELGTTEGGSSGSCIFNPSNGLCVGTLTTGSASCSNPNGFDIYGRFDLHYTGLSGASSSGRLLDWLDPLGTGQPTLEGRDPGGAVETVTWVVHAAASTPGAGDSDWRSQIVVVNPTGETRTATVHYVRSGAVWPGTVLTGPVEIAPASSLFLDDPLLPLNPTSGLVAVVLDGRGPVVFSRTFNLEPGGATFGQGIPGVLIDDVETPTELVLPMLHSAPGRFRANLGLVQASAGTLTVLVQAYRADGSLLATRTLNQSSAFLQVNDLLSTMGIGDAEVEGGWVRVRLSAGAPAWWDAYLSVVDDRTDDPTFEAAMRSE